MKKLRNFLDRQFILVDTVIAFIYSFYAWWLFKHCIGFLEKDFILTLFNAGISLLGFLIATASIIITFKDGPKIEMVQRSGHYLQVIRIYISAIFWTAVFTTIFIIAIPFKIDQIYLQIAFIFFVIFNLIKVTRCIWIIQEMFDLSIPAPKK